MRAWIGLTRPDQTRPDQTRPDQTRPDQTRLDSTPLHSTGPQVPTTCEQGDAEDVPVSLVVRVFVSYTGTGTLENVTLVASCTPPLFLTADTVVLPSLAGGNRTPTIVPFTFRTRTAELPVSLSGAFMATYSTPTGEPRCARCDVLLPLATVANPSPPVKMKDGYKITIETNRAPPPLAVLFEDVLAKQPQLLEAMTASGGSAISLHYFCGKWPVASSQWSVVPWPVAWSVVPWPVASESVASGQCTTFAGPGDTEPTSPGPSYAILMLTIRGPHVVMWSWSARPRLHRSRLQELGPLSHPVVNVRGAVAAHR